MDEQKTLADGLLEELARCRELLEQYAEISAMPNAFTGFATAHIKADIARTEKAMIEGDTVEMLRCYEALKGKR